MARTERAQIVIEIRGGVKAAREGRAVASSQRELGEQIDETGDQAEQTAIALGLLYRQLQRVKRQTGSTAVGVLGVVSAMTMLKVVALGVALTALPSTVAALGATAIAAVALGSALIGVAAGAGLMAAGVVQRFKAMENQAGSAAARLKEQASLIKEAFGEATARGADSILGGLASGLQAIRPLVSEFTSEFTAIGRATGGQIRAFFAEINKLGPQIGSLLRSLPPVVNALGGMARQALGLFLQLANAGMPFLVKGIDALSAGMQQLSEWLTPARVAGAFQLLGRIVQTVGRFIGGIASQLRDVIGPAASAFGRFMAQAAGPLGVIAGAVVGALMRLATAALPGITAAIQMLAPVFASIAKSPFISVIGKALGDGLKAAIGYVGQLIAALLPMKPIVVNVIWPLVKGIAQGLAGALRGVLPIIRGVATFLGWVGQKARPLSPVFQTIGRIIGTLFAGAILKVIGLAARVGGFVVRVLGAIGRLGGPIRAVANLFSGTFNVVKNAVSSAASWVASKVSAIIGTASRLASGFVERLSGLPGKVAGIFRGLGSTIVDTIKGGVSAVFNAAKGLGKAVWDGIKSGVKSVAGAGLKIVSKVPGMGWLGQASGGVMTRPGLSWVGERGPELVALPRGATTFPASTSAQFGSARSLRSSDHAPLRARAPIAPTVSPLIGDADLSPMVNLHLSPVIEIPESVIGKAADRNRTRVQVRS
jgi:phage-related protein